MELTICIYIYAERQQYKLLIQVGFSVKNKVGALVTVLNRFTVSTSVHTLSHMHCTVSIFLTINCYPSYL